MEAVGRTDITFLSLFQVRFLSSFVTRIFSLYVLLGRGWYKKAGNLDAYLWPLTPEGCRVVRSGDASTSEDRAFQQEHPRVQMVGLEGREILGAAQSRPGSLRVSVTTVTMGRVFGRTDMLEFQQG